MAVKNSMIPDCKSWDKQSFIHNFNRDISSFMNPFGQNLCWGALWMSFAIFQRGDCYGIVYIWCQKKGASALPLTTIWVHCSLQPIPWTCFEKSMCMLHWFWEARNQEWKAFSQEPCWILDWSPCLSVVPMQTLPKPIWNRFWTSWDRLPHCKNWSWAVFRLSLTTSLRHLPKTRPCGGYPWIWLPMIRDNIVWSRRYHITKPSKNSPLKRTIHSDHCRLPH